MPNKMPLHKRNEPRKPRLSAEARGYGTAYRKMRRTVLNTYPICQHCNLRPSEETHHLRYGLNLGLGDLLAVCSRCHDEIERSK